MSGGPASELRELQRWILTLISHPDGPVAGEVAARTARLLPERDGIDERLEPSPSMSAAERIGVYAGMYFERLIEALEADYPGLRHALGPEAFRAVGRDFAVRHPSTSFTLTCFGDRLPAYLAGSAEALPHGSFLAELATLERAVVDVFHERRVAAWTAEALATVPAEEWSQRRLKPVAAVRLLRFEFPVNEYLEGVRAGRSPVVPAARASVVLVHRPQLTVIRHDLEPAAGLVLEDLFAGAPLAAGLERALQSSLTSEEDLLQKVGGWFQEWMSWGLFAGPEAAS